MARGPRSADVIDDEPTQPQHRRASVSDAIPPAIDDADSAAIDDPDARRDLRGKRTTGERLYKLEEKHDALIAKLLDDQLDSRRKWRGLLVKVLGYAAAAAAGWLAHKLGIP